jgi:hypothetical protein
LPLQSAKAERLGLGTRRPSQAVEWWWWKGSSAEEVKDRSGYGLAPKEVTGGLASGGASGGRLDSSMVDRVRPVMSQ